MVEVFIPEDLSTALDILDAHKAIPFAGGTDIMVRAKRWTGVVPKFDSPVMFIGQIGELKEIALSDGELTIGAMCTLADLLRDERLPTCLREAISQMASPAIRNVATIGGNICNASPAGDTLPPLYAMNAMLTIKSRKCVKKVPIYQFIKGPGATIRKRDEILCSITIPIENFNVSFYRKVGTRKATALAKLSFLGLARITDDKIEDVRIAFGAVAPTVIRSRETEENIIGMSLQEVEKMLPEIIERYSRLIRPIDDQRSTAEYRKNVSLNLLRYFLVSCGKDTIGG